ncbi:hypothetical protein V2J09_000872 [Rumex salicifolius]
MNCFKKNLVGLKLRPKTGILPTVLSTGLSSSRTFHPLSVANLSIQNPNSVVVHARITMLQWMGGSRRKVNDYFEQRKRQQHERIASSLDDLVDGYDNTSSKNQKEKRSLDVLSMHGLSKVAEGCISTCDGVRTVDSLSKECLNTRNLPKIINKIVTAANNVETLQTRNMSNTQESRMIEGEFRVGPSNLYTSTSTEGNPKGGEQKNDSGQTSSVKDFKDLTVFELVDEDGKSSNNKEEKAVYETHVAFSMQGLGKVGNKTPVKSPQSSRRILSDSQSGFFDAAKHQRLHINFDNLLADHEIETESMIENGDMFSDKKYMSSEYSQSWRSGSHDFLKEDTKTFYDGKPWVKSFDGKENVDNIQEFHTNFFEVNTGFPIGSSYNEHFDMPRESGCFTDYGRTDRFCDLGADFSNRYPNHQLPEDYDVLKSDDSNYIPGNKFLNAGAKQSRFSFLKADNPMDTFSSLSGDSCSSSAVKGDSLMGAPTSRKTRKRSNAFVGATPNNRSITKDFLGQPGMSAKHVPRQQGNYDSPRAYSRPVGFSDIAFDDTFDQVDDFTGKDEFHSKSIDIARRTKFGSSCHKSNKDHSPDCKPVGEDIFGLLSAPNFHFDSYLSFSGCKDDSSVESASPMGLPSKTSAFVQEFTSYPDNGCQKNKKGSNQGIGTLVQSSNSTEVSGKRERKDLLTEHSSVHRIHDNNIMAKVSLEEKLCAGPEGTVSVTPKPFREAQDKLSKENTDGILGNTFQENDNDTSSFFGLSDNSGSRASEKYQNNNLDMQSQQLDPEISDSEHHSMASNGEDSSIEPSYQLMMLESHMLQLLCVKKKRKSAQKEALKTVIVNMSCLLYFQKRVALQHIGVFVCCSYDKHVFQY